MGLRPSLDASLPRLDVDGDGLCFDTEMELGTNPERADTDADDLPDLTELGAGFDPISPGSPAADQVGFLVARAGASLEFPAHATISGDGAQVSGFFEPADGFGPQDGRSAADFFAGAVAESADPVDNVRSIDRESGRFDAVSGETWLGFRLRFEYRADGPVSCARAYPFRYLLKDDRGNLLGGRRYLLVVTPPGPEPDYCVPTECE
ncbi:MAG: hypothetical protein PVI30_15400 [Myxococcales bacterium]